MASFLLSELIQKKVANTGLSKETLTSLDFLLTEAKIKSFENASAKFNQKISSNHLFHDCKNLIQKMLTKNFDIERNIKKKQFNEALKQKKVLENKLSQVSENIKSFKILEDINTLYAKPKRMTQKTRKQYFEDEKKKVEALAEKIQKFAEMHKKTENFLRTEGEKTEKKQKESEE